jgi:hypothetical protein
VRLSSAHGGAHAAFLAAGVAAARLSADESATDTVTNFTTSLAPLRAAGARHVAVLTSAAHARRAAAVAALTLGAGGVGTTVFALHDASLAPPESWARCARDAARAAAWALTGLHGGAAGRLLHPERFRHLDALRRARR